MTETKAQSETQKLIALVRELQTYDHCFLSPEGVEHFTAPFGLTVEPVVETDNRSEFKGLTLHDAEEGDEAAGRGAHIVACAIASHLGIDYTSYHGVGSQLAGACEEIVQHLEAL